MKVRWSELELKILKENYHLGINEVCKLFPNRTKKSVSSQAYMYGLNNRFTYNEDYFLISNIENCS